MIEELGGSMFLLEIRGRENSVDSHTCPPPPIRPCTPPAWADLKVTLIRLMSDLTIRSTIESKSLLFLNLPNQVLSYFIRSI